MNPEELSYWYWLTDAKGIGPIISRRLLDEFGAPAAVFNAEKSEIVVRTGIRNSLADNIERSKNNIGWYVRLAENQLKVAEIVNGHILTCADSPYTGFYRIHNGDRALPPIIHAIGNINYINSRTFAVVGTRKPSDNAREKVGELVHNLATKNLTIVSGLALGIDETAHRAAIEAGGKTIAVLGCGADIKYPSENAALYSSIIDRGLIVSEFPFGTRPTSENLRKRNRTIISLSEAVVIADCPLQSGAMIAARFAAQQKKPIFTFHYGETGSNLGGEWLITKRLAGELKGSTAEDFFHALDNYQPIDTNIDKMFSEIWPKKPRKSRLETKVVKSNKEKGGVGASQAITQDSEAHHSETLQSTMTLGDSATEQGIADNTNKSFNLKLGDHVMHSTFGKGKIINITKNGDDYQITIRFSGKKIRTLSWQYASLTKL
jgi:DNA processing protein